MINQWGTPNKSSACGAYGRAPACLRCSLLLCAFLLLCSTRSIAHDLGLSGITIEVKRQTAEVTAAVPISRLMQMEGLSGAGITPVACDLVIRKRLHILLDGEPFSPAHALENTEAGSDMLTWHASMPVTNGRVSVQSRIFPEDPLARTLLIVKRDGCPTFREMLDDAHPLFTDSRTANTINTESGWSTARRYCAMGMQHIFTGADHILFVIALLLTASCLRTVLKTVTAFTVAHSITLSVAALSAVTPPSRVIEPLIALSICIAAAENMRRLGATQDNPAQAAKGFKPDWRLGCAFCFGLIHGFGFAGGIREAGMPRGMLALPLASFNAGVELGQCAVVLAVLPPLLWAAKKDAAAHARLAAVCSCAVGVIGAYWCFSRMHGGS